MLYTLRFFSSKCSLFHNANLFGSRIIHILYTGCDKIKKNNSGAKGLREAHRMNSCVNRVLRITFGSDWEDVKRAWRKLQIEVCVTQLRHKYKGCQTGRQRRLKRGSAANRLLGLRVRIPPVAWMSICCECCVLSDRSLCDELITSPCEPHTARACVRACVCVCHLVWSLITVRIVGCIVVTPRGMLDACSTVGEVAALCGAPLVPALRLTVWRLTTHIWVVPHR